MKRTIFILLSSILKASLSSQVANYISNGSFEEVHNCSGASLMKAKGWLSIDSVSYGGSYNNYCNNRVPANANTFQFPRTGQGYVLSTWFNQNSYTRGYLKNRLKSTLIAG